MKDNELLNGRILKTQQENEQQMIEVNILKNENHEKNSELKLKEEEINTLRQENMKLAKLRETIQRKLRAVEDHKSEIEQDKETLKSNIIGLERGLFVYGIFSANLNLTNEDQLFKNNKKFRFHLICWK